MRALAWFIVLAVALLSTGTLLAQEQTFPAGIPDATVPAEPGVPASPANVQPVPLENQPQVEVPSPIAPSEPPTGYLPFIDPPVPDVPGDFIAITAELVRTAFEDGVAVLTVAEGNVTARFRDLLVTSERARVDYRTNIAAFEGNVVFRLGIQSARAERVTLNFRTRQWTATGADTTIEPEFAQGFLTAPIFAEAQRVEGVGQRELHLFDGAATTCNLENEHYLITSRSISVYPERRITFRDATLYVLGRRIFRLPRLVIPLRQIERNPNIIPRVGQNAEEGFFLKTAYSYMGTAAQAGFLLLDLMSEKGFGRGVRHSYQFPGLAGTVQLYQLFDRNIDQSTLTGRLDHTQLLGTIRANLSSDLRSNSYLYAPESKTMVNQLTLTRDRIGANSSLTINQNANNTFTRTSRTTGYLRHRQLFGPRSSLDANFEYIDFTGAFQDTARLTSQALFTRDQGAFDWYVSAQKIDDMTEDGFAGLGGFGGIERLPEIGLTSDTTRLGRTLFGVPARMRVAFGNYAELPADIELGRAFVELVTPVQRYAIRDNWNLNAGAGFRQYAYSDNTAQYTFDTSAELVRTLGPTSQFNLTYRYQRPRGFAPFRFDFIGRYNILNASLNLRDSERFRLSFLTGYNFEQSTFPWQDAVVRFTYQPTDSFLIYTGTGYDINRGQWRTVINQLRFRTGDAFSMDVGTRFDPARGELAAARVLLDARVDARTRLQAVAGYSGFTGTFDYRNLMITRDLHCWEASLVYVDQSGFYRNRGISLNLRIKAFPIFRDFGVGPFGQVLDTSVGQVY